MALGAGQLWCTGPCTISVNGSPFGTAEYAPSITIYETWAPVMNDLGGPSEPFDKQWMRQHAIIQATMTRWDENVYGLVQGQVNVKAGTEGPSDVGTFMIQEGFALQVQLDFPYASSGAFPGMPKGYLFYACSGETQDLNPVGTQARKLGITFTAIQQWTGSGFNFYKEL